MNNRPGILIIDRDAIAAQVLQKQLEAQGHTLHHAPSIASASELLQCLRAKPDGSAIGVALIDQDAMGQGHDAMHGLLVNWPGIVPIVTSAFRKVESAVAAMRLGAADYLLKPIIEKELIDAVQRAMQRHLLIVERELAQEDVGQPLGQTLDTNDPQDDRGAQDWHPMPLSEAMKAPERRILLAALEANEWNRSETAKQLDINRTTLYKKIRQHRLDEPA
ncbi:MAG: helix-turn-helix domain-containing protein [Phycisphaeraceae bacterium]